MKSNRLLLLIILILILALTASSYLVVQTTILSGKAASSSSTQIVLSNSYLFISPLQAKADGQQRSRATVFVLNSQGLGVAGRTIVLKTSPASIIQTPLQPVTDDTGKAIFDLSSTTPGRYSIEAYLDHTPIPQKAYLLFQ